jgi:1,2-diacylglycerol 3-alpha-glucosyltransferase
MDKLGIAFYTDSYLPAVDGVVSSILNFRAELEKRGHRVYIFSSCKIGTTKPNSSKVFLYPGIDFKPYPQYSMALFPYNSLSKLKSLNIDLIHAHTPLVMGFAGLMSAKLGRYPIIGSYHTVVNNKTVVDDYYPKNKQLKRLTSKYMLKYIQFFYRRCNATTVPSNVIARMLKNYGGIENIQVVPNSVDLLTFNPKADGSGMRNVLKIKNREKTVLYLGRLSKEKKIEVLLKAAAVITRKREDVKFIIGGAGPAEVHYKNLAKKLGIQRHVKFLGHVERKKLPGLYAAADLLCLPSTFETQGIVSLEAMATGKPVVGANYLALRELIKNGRNGEKFAPGDHLDCARKIEKVLNDSSPYIRDALSTAKEFSVEKVTDRLLDVYDLVLSNYNGGFTDRQ